MTDKRLVLTMCGSLEEARSISHALVERQLAACVNIAPQIESVYRWQGEIETATVFRLGLRGHLVHESRQLIHGRRLRPPARGFE